MKCRQTGIVGEIYKKMGMNTVNMPGGEIVPSAERGVIDCAEWVGGVEDLRLGLPQVWKYHYTPGMHENASIGELIINKEVWDGLTPQQQEAIRSATTETLVRWWVKWQKQNADAIEEMQTKHGTQILRTPPEILTEFFKAWDEIAKEEMAVNPIFKKDLRVRRRPTRPRSCRPSASCSRPTRSRRTTTSRRSRASDPRNWQEIEGRLRVAAAPFQFSKGGDGAR